MQAYECIVEWTIQIDKPEVVKIASKTHYWKKEFSFS